ncbi:unnamed protein product, partial [Discosporangium mesarthrocarpum]
ESSNRGRIPRQAYRKYLSMDLNTRRAQLVRVQRGMKHQWRVAAVAAAVVAAAAAVAPAVVVAYTQGLGQVAHPPLYRRARGKAPLDPLRWNVCASMKSLVTR